MNTKNLHQIFANYIDRFEELNDPEHNETFKWWAAKQFRKQMDAAFKQSGHNFAVALDHSMNRINTICTKQMRQSFLRIAWSTMAIGALATKLN